MLRVLIIFLLISVALPAAAQDDSTSTSKPKRESKIDTSHSPRTATLLSLALPGAGQVYNRKYWKVPLVYAGIGVSVYYIVENNRQFNNFKQAYLDRLENDSIHIGTDFEFFSATSLRTVSDQYRRRRDLSYVFTALFYFLNVIDANVDAHMLHFDVSEDLTLEAGPTLLPRTFTGFSAAPQAGLRLRLKF